MNFEMVVWNGHFTTVARRWNNVWVSSLTSLISPKHIEMGNFDVIKNLCFLYRFHLRNWSFVVLLKWSKKHQTLLSGEDAPPISLVCCWGRILKSESIFSHGICEKRAFISLSLSLSLALTWPLISCADATATSIYFIRIFCFSHFIWFCNSHRNQRTSDILWEEKNKSQAKRRSFDDVYQAEIVCCAHKMNCAIYIIFLWWCRFIFQDKRHEIWHEKRQSWYFTWPLLRYFVSQIAPWHIQSRMEISHFRLNIFTLFRVFHYA